MKKRHQQKLIFTSLVLFIGFNMPIVLLFDKAIHLLGMPLMLLFLFLFWGLGILISYIILNKYYE